MTWIAPFETKDFISEGHNIAAIKKNMLNEAKSKKAVSQDGSVVHFTMNLPAGGFASVMVTLWSRLAIASSHT